MNATDAIDQLCKLAGFYQSSGEEGVASLGEEDAQQTSLAGLFQQLRPDGLVEQDFLDSVPGGAAFRARMNRLYEAVLSSQRNDGMKDAYFIVRDPPWIQASDAERLARQFLQDTLAWSQLQSDLPAFQDTEIAVRVLEGKAPKLPRAKDEHSTLMRLLNEQLPTRVEQLFSSVELAHRLAEPLYFVACDAWLRYFLRWPLLAASDGHDSHAPSTLAVDRALAGYFELWRHGIKFRAFSDRQVDFYLPKRTDGRLVDPGR